MGGVLTIGRELPERGTPVQRRGEKRRATARPRLGAALLLLLLSACAARPPDAGGAQAPEGDPLEPLNRQVFAVNEAFDTFLLRPATTVYGDFTPGPVKQAVHNLVRHLSLPVTALNDLAQGEWRLAGDMFWRFFLNSTLGMAGLHDAAEDYGLAHRSADFGDTLAAWGLPEGPYLVLPIAGPSSLRAGAGLLVEGAADPVNIGALAHSMDDLPGWRAVAAAVDFRHRNRSAIDDFKVGALDYYSFIRTLYRQRRAFEADEDREAGADDDPDGLREDYAYPPPRPNFRRESGDGAPPALTTGKR